MLLSERRQYILERLERDGRIIAKDISRELDLSEDTIRRDLRELAQEGLLQRVHGGALPASPAIADFEEREAIYPDAKIAIGRTVASTIEQGQVVILDGGTTSIQIAKHLPRNLEATIVTHSARTAVELVYHPKVEVILIGGQLFKHSIVSVGAAALQMIKQIRADIYFMGVTGIHPEEGLSTGDFEEARIKYALLEQSAETFVLASQEKLGTVSPYVITSLDNISGIFVEDSTHEDILLPYRHLGLHVILSDG